MPQALAPALVRAPRPGGALQIGLDPDRAVVLAGLTGPVLAALRSPGASADLALALAGTVDPAEGARLLDLLARAGALVERVPAAAQEVERGGPGVPARLEPDAASAALLRRSAGAGSAVLAARSRAWVQVHGGGRVGAAVGALLASAGVGTVLVDDAGAVRPSDLVPGMDATDVGQRRGPVAERLAVRCAAAPRDPDPGPGARPDLVVVAPVTGLGRDAAHAALCAGVPHLLALVVETTGVVGPLVLPGRSPCVRCLDLSRTDRDPGWPAVLTASADAPVAAAGDVALCALVAASAAQQALAHLDGWTPAAVGATLETSAVHGLPRRRSWPAHPACGCQWPAAVPAG